VGLVDDDGEGVGAVRVAELLMDERGYAPGELAVFERISC
jgi:hypothetical protein